MLWPGEWHIKSLLSSARVGGEDVLRLHPGAVGHVPSRVWTWAWGQRDPFMFLASPGWEMRRSRRRRSLLTLQPK